MTKANGTKWFRLPFNEVALQISLIGCVYNQRLRPRERYATQVSATHSVRHSQWCIVEHTKP